MNGNDIQKRLKASGRKQVELADFTGLSPDIINKIIKGKRGIKSHEADKIRAFFRDAGTDEPTVVQRPLKGYVQAGVWMDAFELPPEDQELYPAPIGAKSYRDKAFWLKVRGDSMNLANMPDGALLLCLRLHDYIEVRDVVSGDKVIAHREGPAGVEATVKELEVRPDGSHWLWPRSDNPEHQMPIKMPPVSEWEDGHGEVSVDAVVIGQMSIYL